MSDEQLVDVVRGALVGELTATDFAALVRDVSELVGLADAALAVVGSWLDVHGLDVIPGELRAHHDRVADLATALERAGLLDRGSSLYPAAVFDLSPRSDGTESDVIPIGDDAP